MKLLIILSVLIVGCIVEPRPEDIPENPEHDCELEGEWEADVDPNNILTVTSCVILEDDVVLSGVLTIKHNDGDFRFVSIGNTLIVFYNKTVRNKFKRI